MKSLILKDLYNIGHNAKSMLITLLFLAVVVIPFQGAEAYIILSGILCSMMIITTFSYDENSKWMKYAMVMPINKKDMVISKFVVLLIFSVIGVIGGLIIGFIGSAIIHQIKVGYIENFLPLLPMTVASFVIAEIFGSVSIPLLFKFGAEKARLLTFIAFIIPFVICFGVYKTLIALGVSFTGSILLILLCLSPLIALIWNLMMYKISYVIFSNKELLY